MNEVEQKTALMSESKPSSRRWLRFSLRTLLLLSTTIAAAAGWVLHKARQQGVAVAALESMGCKIGVADYGGRLTALEQLRKTLGEKTFRTVHEVVISPWYIDDAGLAHLESLPGIVTLEFEGGELAKFTDAGLVHAQRLPNLSTLRLHPKQMTAAGMSYLVGLKQLTNLWACGERITDAHLAHLRGLSQITDLVLMDANVTNAGLRHLQGMTGLQYLDLSGTKVSDDGLVQLLEHSHLRFLNLSDTQVTKAGVLQALQLPELKNLYLEGSLVGDETIGELETQFPDVDFGVYHGCP